MPVATQQYLHEKTGVLLPEIPVLFFTKTSQEWSLLCIRQLFGCQNGTPYSIPLQDIEHITSKKFSSEDAKLSTALKKSEWHELIVTGKDGQAMLFHAQMGPDLFALWNILLMAVRFYR